MTVNTTKEQDFKIFRNVRRKQSRLKKQKENYNVLFNNCAQILIDCIEDGTELDVKDGFTPVPNDKFENLKESEDEN